MNRKGITQGAIKKATDAGRSDDLRLEERMMKTQNGTRRSPRRAGSRARLSRLWTAVAIVTLMLLLASTGTHQAAVHAQAPGGTSAPQAKSPDIGPQAWIERPREGETLALEPLTFDAYATDAGGGRPDRPPA